MPWVVPTHWGLENSRKYYLFEETLKIKNVTCEKYFTMAQSPCLDIIKKSNQVIILRLDYSFLGG